LLLLRHSLRGSVPQKSQAADLPREQVMPVEMMMNLCRGTVHQHEPDPF